MTTPDTTPARRYLVVANQTLGGRQLLDKIHEYTAAGPCRFHVLVPATPIQQYRWPPPLAVPTTAGGGVFAESAPVPEAAGDTHARARAHARLREELARLKELGVDADGEVGDPDPLEAIREILTRGRFDEIILATLPPGISRWLRMDLPHRVARSTNLPVTHVVSQAGQDRVS